MFEFTESISFKHEIMNIQKTTFIKTIALRTDKANNRFPGNKHINDVVTANTFHQKDEASKRENRYE